MPDVKLQCKSAACQREFFGVVMFCPFCGMAQQPVLASAAAKTIKPSEKAIEDGMSLGAVKAAPPINEKTSPATQLPPVKEVAPVSKAKAPIGAAVLPASEQAQETKPVPAKNPAPKRHWLRYLVVFIGVLVAWQLIMPSGPDACDTALAAVTAESRVDKARNKALEAIDSCKGERQQSAKVQLAELEKTMAAAKSCEAATAQYKSLLAGGRLTEANSVVLQKMRTCPGSNLSQTAARDIEDTRRTVAGKVEMVRKKIESNDLAGAKQLVEEIQKLDRNNSNISLLRTVIEQAERVARTAAVPAAPRIIPLEALPPRIPSAPSANQNSRENVAAEMANVMLRDGESALAQRRYSDAKALASSVMRAVPSQQARDLFNRANEAEARALRDDTTLK